MIESYVKKKNSSLKIFICVLGILIFFNYAQISEANTINQKNQIVVGFNKYPPYHYMNEKKEAKGIVVEIANTLASKLNIKINYRELPWSRCINYAKKGKIDAILFIFKKPEREEFLHYFDNNLICYETNALYALKGNEIKFSGNIANELKPYKIGAMQDFSYGAAFDSVADKLKIENVQDVEILIKKLLNKRSDLIIHNTLLINWYCKKMGVSNEIAQIPPPITKSPGYIAFSKAAGTNELAKSFADAMKNFKQTEDYKIIIDKYESNK